MIHTQDWTPVMDKHSQIQYRLGLTITINSEKCSELFLKILNQGIMNISIEVIYHASFQKMEDRTRISNHPIFRKGEVNDRLC